MITLRVEKEKSRPKRHFSVMPGLKQQHCHAALSEEFHRVGSLHDRIFQEKCGRSLIKSTFMQVNLDRHQATISTSKLTENIVKLFK